MRHGLRPSLHCWVSVTVPRPCSRKRSPKVALCGRCPYCSYDAACVDVFRPSTKQALIAVASPVGHAMVGLASAAVVARVTGAPHSAELWLGSFIASGLPDLDVVPGAFGFSGPRFHRNGSHSLVVLGAIMALGWIALNVFPIGIDWRVALAWSVALASHPVLDLLTSGPIVGEKGYGIGLFWPLHRKRWFVKRPIIDQATNWGACRTVRDVWEGVRPELVKLGPVSLLVILLALIL